MTIKLLRQSCSNSRFLLAPSSVLIEVPCKTLFMDVPRFSPVTSRVSIVRILTHSLSHLDSVLNKWDDAGNSVTSEHPLHIHIYLHCSCSVFLLTFFFLLLHVFVWVCSGCNDDGIKLWQKILQRQQRWMCSLRFFFAPSLLLSLKWCHDKIKQSSQREVFT